MRDRIRSRIRIHLCLWPPEVCVRVRWPPSTGLQLLNRESSGHAAGMTSVGVVHCKPHAVGSGRQFKSTRVVNPLVVDHRRLLRFQPSIDALRQVGHFFSASTAHHCLYVQLESIALFPESDRLRRQVQFKMDEALSRRTIHPSEPAVDLGAEGRLNPFAPRRSPY
jgi:hypothetical protein